MINYNHLKSMADELFWIFEEELFENKGNYTRKTNLVLEFSDFIEQADKETLEQYVHFRSDEEFVCLKKIIKGGIADWLNDGDIKTLFV